MTFHPLVRYKLRISYILMALVVLSGLGEARSALASSACDETILTEGATAHNALNVQAFGQYVVWVDFQWDETGTHDYTIHIYDTETRVDQTVQEGVGPETVPDFADGKVVWTGPTYGYGEVYLYDLSTGTIIQLSDNDGTSSVTPPRIHGNTVYWATRGESFPSAITLYDLNSTDKHQIMLEEYADFPEPDMEGDTLVWVAVVNQQVEIVQYDTNTHVMILLTDSQQEFGTEREGYSLYHHPQIRGDLILWQRETVTRMEGGNYDYVYEWFLYDGTETRLVSTSYSSIAVYAPYIVWSNSDGHDNELFLYNIDSGSTVQITDNDFDEYTAEISGNQVVWGNYDEGIFLYDIPTGETILISDTQYVGAAQLGDGFITWMADVDLHGGNVVLCMYEGA